LPYTFLHDIKAIILDMDGVIVDSEPIHMNAFKIFLEKYSIETNPNYLISMIGHSVESNFEMLKKDFPQFKEKNVQKLIDERNAIFIDLIEKSALQPISGISELIDFCLNSGIKLGLASSSDQIQIDAILKSISNNTDNDINISNVFKTIVSGDSVSHKKPAADIYLKALENLNVPATSAIAVEDSQAGITSAKAAGITCLALKNPYFDIEEMTGYDLALNTIHDLVELLFEE
jgi:beta-phosphoglucomutase-like phosphatase (HAD superfamily)